MSMKIAVTFDNTTDSEEVPVPLTAEMITFRGENGEIYTPESVENGNEAVYVIEADNESVFFDALEDNCDWCYTGAGVLMDPDPYPIGIVT